MAGGGIGGRGGDDVPNELLGQNLTLCENRWQREKVSR